MRAAAEKKKADEAAKAAAAKAAAEKAAADKKAADAKAAAQAKKEADAAKAKKEAEEKAKREAAAKLKETKPALPELAKEKVMCLNIGKFTYKNTSFVEEWQKETYGNYILYEEKFPDTDPHYQWRRMNENPEFSTEKPKDK